MKSNAEIRNPEIREDMIKELEPFSVDVLQAALNFLKILLETQE